MYISSVSMTCNRKSFLSILYLQHSNTREGLAPRTSSPYGRILHAQCPPSSDQHSEVDVLVAAKGVGLSL